VRNSRERQRLGSSAVARQGNLRALSQPFVKAIGEAGFVEGQNLAIPFRWAEGRYDCHPAD
jgi:hypothetical protein